MTGEYYTPKNIIDPVGGSGTFLPDIMEYALGLAFGIDCTCCGQSARKQCLDHDTGYGVCDSCLARYGRSEFCHIARCTAHDQEGKPK